MEVIAYYILHYGTDFLEASIKSIEPCVDKIVIFYSRTPTFGRRAAATLNPDTPEMLYKIATEASDKVMWIEVTGIGDEARHRNLIEEMADGYDLILAVDSDEVWDTNELRAALDAAHQLNNQYIMISGFMHFWKSFNHVCIDHWTPVRITNRKATNKIEQGTVTGKVYHFSLAQREEVIRYKWSGIHGHQDELRPNWLEEIFFEWKEGMNDVHPTTYGIWNVQNFDKTTMPPLLMQHKYYEKETI